MWKVSYFLHNLANFGGYATIPLCTAQIQLISVVFIETLSLAKPLTPLHALCIPF